MNMIAADDARIYHDARANEAWGGAWSRAHDRSRTRARKADLVLSVLCSIVAFLAIEDVGDRSLLFEHYDIKLWSYQDRLPSFCLSVLPSVFGMALVLATYKTISMVRSVI
ncbi:MAG: hypothetical protein ABR910_04710 [Acidobacteriaceae bacterium]